MDTAESSITPAPAGASSPEMLIEVSTLEPGTLIVQRYRIVRQMGEDNIGVSILVEDVIWGEEIILKFLQESVASNTTILRSFIQELRDARSIVHANILNMYDLLLLGPTYVLSYEYFAGRSLVEELKQGPLAIRRGMRIARDICLGLHHAHQLGMVHRELTPAHIIVNYAGGAKVVRNFVAVEDIKGKPSDEDALLRAPMYLAPEHVHQGVLDARANVYTLGILMYEMFTGTPPYTNAEPLALLLQHMAGNPIPPRRMRPDLPVDLEALILRAMAVDPSKRFQSMDQLRRHLIALFRQTPVSGVFYAS
jgi:serine/threonine-protein kinase